MPETMRPFLRADAMRLRRYLRSKYGYVPLTWFMEPAWLCVVLHRLSHRGWLRGSGKSARFWMQLNSLLTGADIQPASDLGGGLLIPSPTGITISAKAGDNLTVLALAGLGGNRPTKDVGAGPGLPLVGRDVQVGQFTGIQGAITVGDAVLFYPGAGAVVNVPSDARMVPQAEPRAGALPDPLPPRAPAASCGHAAWRQTAAHWAQDRRRLTQEMMRFAPPGNLPPSAVSVSLTTPMLALWVYRTSHWLHCNAWSRLARLLAGINLILHKLTIPPEACLGGGVLMPHLAGLVLHGRAGSDLALYANAVCSCLGDATIAPVSWAPCLGDGVMIGGHSGAFGAITLGDGVQLGPKVQVAQDVAAGMQVWDPHSRGTIDASQTPPIDRTGPVASCPASVRPWRQTWRRFGEDRARWRDQPGTRRAPMFPGLVCVALHRLSHVFHLTGWRRPARWCAVANLYLTGADITPASSIGGGLLMPHPAGVALHGMAGRNLTVMAAAGFGALLRGGDELAPLDAAPRLGDGVRLDHHSGVFGPVTVGDGVTIRPGCIMNRSVPALVTMLPWQLRVRDRLKVERMRAESRTSRTAQT